MKYLKYALGGLAGLVIAFFLLGVFKPTLSYECEVSVNKPLEESWVVMQDESKMSEWLEGFQKIEPVSGIPGTVGAVSLVYFDNDGDQMTIKETITEIVPNESISMQFEDEFMVMDYKLSMVFENGKTKISSHTAAEGTGAISKSIMVLVGGMIQGQEETNLANLKKVIEGN